MITFAQYPAMKFWEICQKGVYVSGFDPDQILHSLLKNRALRLRCRSVAKVKRTMQRNTDEKTQLQQRKWKSLPQTFPFLQCTFVPIRIRHIFSKTKWKSLTPVSTMVIPYRKLYPGAVRMVHVFSCRAFSTVKGQEEISFPSILFLCASLWFTPPF